MASIIAGLLFAFSTNRALYAALGHYDMITTQWIPFYPLTLLQSLDGSRTAGQRRKSAALASGDIVLRRGDEQADARRGQVDFDDVDEQRARLAQRAAFVGHAVEERLVLVGAGGPLS